MNCESINLRRGSKGEDVKTIQTLLSSRGYYDGRIDGDYGVYTENAVKQFQRRNGLLQDGWVGPVTCRKLQNNPGVYTNYTLCEKQGGGCLGQTNAYRCGPHAIMQALRKFGITGYSEATIAGYAGTTTAGTGHSGLETAIAKIARLEGVNLQVEWKNFSDLGGSTTERFKTLGEHMTDSHKSVFWHELYRGQYGHYSLAKTVNTNTGNLLVANSLGNRCGSPAYCGYLETRSFSTQVQYFRGISQRSICIITKK